MPKHKQKPLRIEKAVIPRMSRIIEAMDKAGVPLGPWKGYRKEEGLGSYKVSDDEVVVFRKAHPDATVRVGYLRLVNIQTQYETEPIVIEESEPERYDEDYNIPEEVSTTATITKTFTKTKSFEDSWQQAWKIGAEFFLAWKAGSATGGPEISAKVTAEYGQTVSEKYSTGETQTDTVSRSVTVKGPADFTLELVRSKKKLQKHIIAVADWNTKFFFCWEAGGWESRFQEDFTRLINGELDPHADPTNMAAYFNANPLSDEEIDAIITPEGGEVDMVVNWDNVYSTKLWTIPHNNMKPKVEEIGNGDDE